MNVKNATPDQIQEAGNNVGVRIHNFRASKGGGWAFTLKTGSPSIPVQDDKGKTKWRAPYRRIAQFARLNGKHATVPGAVCWHGHRDYFRELYRLAPNAIVKTSMATYRNAEHFEATFPSTQESPSSWQERAFSRTPKLAYQNACSCSEADNASSTQPVPGYVTEFPKWFGPNRNT